MTEAASLASHGQAASLASHGHQEAAAALQHNYSNLPSVQAAASLAANTSFPGNFHLPPPPPPSSHTSFSLQPPPIPSSAPPQEGAVRAVPSRPPTPPSERQRRRERALAEEMRNSKLAEIEDLIRLQGPLTEDAVLRTLQARFYSRKCQVSQIMLVKA